MSTDQQAKAGSPNPVVSRDEYPSFLPQETRAPEWWYQIFQQGHHDMNIYKIEWAWEAYLRLKPKDER